MNTQTATKTFKILGLTLFSYTVTTSVDEEALYKRIVDRLGSEVDAALVRARTPRA